MGTGGPHIYEDMGTGVPKIGGPHIYVTPVQPPHEICSRNRNAVAANQIACSRNVTVMVRVISNIVS